MVGLLTFLGVVFSGSSVSRAIVSLGKFVGVAVLVLEVRLHRKNAEIGRNPWVDQQRKQREEIDSKKGFTVVPDISGDSYGLFMIAEKDIDQDDLKRFAGAWFLTATERTHLSDMFGRDLYTRITRGEEAEIGRLRAISDNRLLRDDLVLPLLQFMGDDKDTLDHFHTALVEVEARKNEAA